MITDYDVYVAFRKAQAYSKNKPYRLPKNWTVFKNSRLSSKNLEFLQKLTDYFNTKWSNICIDDYMQYGFELYKNFSYHQFFKQNVIDLYIEKDKQKKRLFNNLKQSIKKTFDYLDTLKINPKNGYTVLQHYCKLKDDNLKCIITDYIQNKINPLVFVYCLYYKYLTLTDIEKENVYYITNNYRELLAKMFKLKSYIQGFENEICVSLGEKAD